MNLKSCPFCGSEVVDWINPVRKSMRSKVAITCGICSTQGPWVKSLDEAERLWNQRATPSPWISVEERLPDFGEDVLIYPAWSGVHEATFSKSDGGFIAGEGDQMQHPTHWMPLPEGPL